jgi:hypothetical protein
MNVRWITLSTVVLTTLLLAGTAAAQEPEPVFGPQTFERTTGETDLYTETFDSAVEGNLLLLVLNGDEEATRVAGATMTLNGNVVVQSSELDEETEVVRRLVHVQAGVNELSVELAGAPGSFITVLLAPRGPSPRLIRGRLLLPWGRNDPEGAVGLALKNGSPRFARVVRVVFFNPMGEAVAASERFVLPPRGSRAFALEELIDAGTWEIGSIEIYYAGRGTARVFGTARHWSLPLGDTEIQQLTHAGAHVFHAGPVNPEQWTDRFLRR